MTWSHPINTSGSEPREAEFTIVAGLQACRDYLSPQSAPGSGRALVL